MIERNEKDINKLVSELDSASQRFNEGVLFIHYRCIGIVKQMAFDCPLSEESKTDITILLKTQLLVKITYDLRN